MLVYHRLVAHEPTPAQTKRARRLVSALTPGRRAHQRYVEAACGFLGVADLLPFFEHQSGRVRLEGLQWYPSVLFRREYLLAHVDTQVLGVIAPECDAIATVLSTVPLILVPTSRRWRRSQRFVSILEHEVVHVNQALLGTVLGASSPASSKAEAVDSFFEMVRVEYEANFIQLATWPSALPRRYGLSLEQWCALRGWTPALEVVARGAFCSPRVMGPFLARIEEEAPARLRAAGVSSAVVAWLLEKHVGFLRLALELEFRRAPPLARNTSFLAAVAWLRRRLKQP